MFAARAPQRFQKRPIALHDATAVFPQNAGHRVTDCVTCEGRLLAQTFTESPPVGSALKPNSFQQNNLDADEVRALAETFG